MGVYGARGQGGNLPWRSANDDYSHAGTVRDSGRDRTERPLEEGETDESFIAREMDENPTLPQLSAAALDVLGDDEQGFWLMIESGDIDWAAHDEDMDAMLGTLKDFDQSIEVVKDWIGNNGGYEENLLIVTADHDHYLTLLDNFPQVLAEELLLGEGGLGLTEDGAPKEVRGAALEEAQEVAEPPVPDTDATGEFDAAFDRDTNVLTVTGSFSNLTSPLFDVSADGVDPEGNAIDALHIHQAAEGANGPVVRALTVTPAEDNLSGTFEGTFTLTEAEAAALENDEFYINLHTENFNGGELRGQIDLARSYGDAEASGHFWGSDYTVDDNGTPEDTSDDILMVNDKYAWGRHTSRPVPVYFQGPAEDEAFINGLVGENYEAYGEVVEGVGTYIDQVHLGLAQLNALNRDTMMQPKIPAFGTLGGDTFDAGVTAGFEGTNNLTFGGAADDLFDTSAGGGGNRLYGQSGDDVFILGSDDRALAGVGDDDIFFLGGNSTATGGEGADEFWLTLGEIPESANMVSDFDALEGDVLGIAGLGIGFDDLTLSDMDGNAMIAFDGNDLGKLLGVDSSSLTAANFAFA